MTVSLPNDQSTDETTGGIESERLLSYIQRFGWNTNSFLLTHGGYLTFESLDPPGLIAYKQRGRTCVVAGDPLCRQDDCLEVLRSFRKSLEPGSRIIFVLASAWLAAKIRGTGFGAIIVGEDPVFDLQKWLPSGKKLKSVRNPINRARRAGVVVTVYEPAARRDAGLERAILDCSKGWLGTRLAEPMGFLAELMPLAGVEHRLFFLAWQGEALVGFVACSPIYARDGWYVEDVIRSPTAPYGVAELLITTVFAGLRDKGAKVATLGVAPFTSAVHEQKRWRQLLLTLLPVITRPFYNFIGIRNFKRKFGPSWWEPVYVVFWPDRVSLGLVYDTLDAFPPDGLVRLVQRWLRHLIARKKQE